MYKLIKIKYIFFIIIVVFLCSCNYSITKGAVIGDEVDYSGEYISVKTVGNNPNEKLHVFINKDNGFYMWIGSSSNPESTNDRFDVYSEDITGEMPNYAFNNNELVGTLTILNKNRINISFAKMIPPSINLQNILCDKKNNTT